MAKVISLGQRSASESLFNRVTPSWVCYVLPAIGHLSALSLHIAREECGLKRFVSLQCGIGALLRSTTEYVGRQTWAWVEGWRASRLHKYVHSTTRWTLVNGRFALGICALSLLPAVAQKKCNSNRKYILRSICENLIKGWINMQSYSNKAFRAHEMMQMIFRLGKLSMNSNALCVRITPHN